MTSDYGTYSLSYTPPESTGNEEYPNIAIEMSTYGDANVDQMLRFFEAFLSAAGYVLKGELQVIGEVTETSETLKAHSSSSNQDFWLEDGYSFVGNPVYGGCSNDTISFAAARPAMEFGAKTWNDVISFG
jgi:hypothetical protein